MPGDKDSPWSVNAPFPLLSSGPCRRRGRPEALGLAVDKRSEHRDSNRILISHTIPIRVYNENFPQVSGLLRDLSLSGCSAIFFQEDTGMTVGQTYTASVSLPTTQVACDVVCVRMEHMPNNVLPLATIGFRFSRQTRGSVIDRLIRDLAAAP